MKYLILFLICAETAYAAGGGKGSVKDLLYPVINAGVFFGLLFLKLKRPISHQFSAWSNRVEQTFNQAAQKSKEASLRLQELEQKLQNADSEREKILADARNQANLIKQNIEQETRKKIEKVKKDSINKLETDKRERVRQLSNEVLDSIINKTKIEIKGNDKNRQQASKKLLSQVSV